MCIHKNLQNMCKFDKFSSLVFFFFLKLKRGCLCESLTDMCVIFLGISLFINNTSKNAFCPSKDVELKKIRKDIIHGKHDRPLCRTTLTISINSIQCEKTVVELSLLCQGNENLSIYFQGDVNNFLKN